MLGTIREWMPGRSLISFLMAVVLGFSLVSCGDRAASQIPGTNRTASTQVTGSISEVAPPQVIQQLRPALEGYQPQVAILSPQPDEVLQDTTLAARFQVQDLPIFKNANLEMGPHLHVILDNQPYIAVYDLAQPLVLEDLTPGTHTLRVFASRPWHESFKNEGAYAQTTFHIFTKTTDNNPDPAQPLLTYSRPKGNYGAEPIMLDFYLTNAPLHLVAQENPNDEIADWRIRVTTNGQSFVLDKWQPIYLKGFKPGKNWVQLEFLDELGNPVKNVFNNTVRLITYEPKGQDTLSKLMRGELSATEARGIVDPNYTVNPKTASPTPTSTPSPEVTPSPLLTPSPTVEVTPSVEPAPAEVEPSQPSAPAIAEPKTEAPKAGGIFNRFRRPAASPSPSPAQPEVVETLTPEPVVPPVLETPPPEASVTPSPAVEVTPSAQPTPSEPQQAEPPKSGLFSRFRRPAASPSLPPTLPEVIDAPVTSAPTPEVSPSLEPSQLLEAKPAAEPTSEAPKNANEELVLPKPTTSQSFRVIQAPNSPTVPNRYLQKTAPSTPAPEVLPSQSPTSIESEETVNSNF